MRHLLGRWARLEPERCSIDGDGQAHFVLEHDTWRWLDSSVTNACVLAAVIEAIEARRWRYRFWGDLGMREAIVVTVDERTDGRERHGAGGPNLPVAAVLLSAYLSALEANQ